MNNDPGPLIRDTDYTSPTYNQMIGNPAYTGAPVTTNNGTGPTIYAGGGTTAPAPAPTGGASPGLKDFSIWAANNPGATQEQGQQAIDYFYRQAGTTPSSGGGYAAPSGYSAASSPLSAGTPTSSAPGSTSAYGGTTQNNASTYSNTASGIGGGAYSRYGNQAYNSEAERYLSTFTQPKTEEEIYQEETRRAQGRIDSLNRYYESLLLDQSRENEARSAEQNALSVMSGLAGSTEASTARMRTEGINTQANAKLQAAKNVELQNIYKEIQTEAYKRFQDERTNARQSAVDAVAMQGQREEKASKYIQTLSQAGFDLDKIKTADPRTYQGLAEAVGGEQMLKALYVLNKPKATIVDKKLENGRYIVVSQNPDGTFKTDVLDLGLPPEYDQSADLGGQMMFFPAGQPEKAIFVNKTMSDKDRETLDQGWYNAATARMKAESDIAGSAGVSSYASDSMTRVKEAVADLKGRVSGWTTGWGGKLSWVPESEAANFDADLATLKGNIAFSALQAMREASKTGGALGQVSNIELGLLESTLGALNTKQSPQNFAKNLQKIEDSATRWLNSATLVNLGGKLNADNKTFTMPDGTVVDPSQ